MEDSSQASSCSQSQSPPPPSPIPSSSIPQSQIPSSSSSTQQSQQQSQQSQQSQTTQPSQSTSQSQSQTQTQITTHKSHHQSHHQHHHSQPPRYTTPNAPPPPPNPTLVYGAARLQEWLEELLQAVSPNSSLQQAHPFLKLSHDQAVAHFLSRFTDSQALSQAKPYFLPVLFATLLSRLTDNHCRAPPEIVLPTLHTAFRRLELQLALPTVLFHPAEIWQHFEAVVGVLQLATTVIWPDNPSRGVPVRNTFVYHNQGDARAAEMASVAAGAVSLDDYRRLRVPPPIAMLTFDKRHFYERNVVLMAAMLQKIIEETCLYHYAREQITDSVQAFRQLPFRLLRLFLTESLGKVVKLLYIGNPQPHFYDLRVPMAGSDSLAVVQEAVFGLITLRRSFCLPDVRSREELTGFINLELVNLLRALADVRAAYGLVEVTRGDDDKHYSVLSAEQLARLQLRILAAQVLYDAAWRRPSITFFRDWISPHSGDHVFGNWLVGSELERNRFKPNILKRDWFSCFSAAIKYYIEILLLTNGSISIGFDDEEWTEGADPESALRYYLNLPSGTVSLYGSELATSLSERIAKNPSLATDTTKVVGILFDPAQTTNPFRAITFYVNGDEVVPIVKEKKIEYQPGYFHLLSQAAKAAAGQTGKSRKKPKKDKGKGKGKSKGKGKQDSTENEPEKPKRKTSSAENQTCLNLSPAMLTIRPSYYQQALIIHQASRWQFVGDVRLNRDVSMVQVIVDKDGGETIVGCNLTAEACLSNHDNGNCIHERPTNALMMGSPAAAAVAAEAQARPASSSAAKPPSINPNELGLVGEWPACQSYEIVEEFVTRRGLLPYEDEEVLELEEGIYEEDVLEMMRKDDDDEGEKAEEVVKGVEDNQPMDTNENDTPAIDENVPKLNDTLNHNQQMKADTEKLPADKSGLPNGDVDIVQKTTDQPPSIPEDELILSEFAQTALNSAEQMALSNGLPNLSATNSASNGDEQSTPLPDLPENDYSKKTDNLTVLINALKLCDDSNPINQKSDDHNPEVSGNADCNNNPAAAEQLQQQQQEPQILNHDQQPDPLPQIPNPPLQIPNPFSQIPNPLPQIPNPQPQIPNPPPQLPNPPPQLPIPQQPPLPPPPPNNNNNTSQPPFIVSPEWPQSRTINATIFRHLAASSLMAARAVCRAFKWYADDAATRVRHLTLLSDTEAATLVASPNDELGPFFYTNTLDRSFSSFRTAGNFEEKVVRQSGLVFHDRLADKAEYVRLISDTFPGVSSLTFAQRSLTVDFFYPLTELLKQWADQLTSLKLVIFTQNKPVFGRVPPEQSWQPEYHYFETEDPDCEDFGFVTPFRALIAALNSLPALRKLTLKYSQIIATTFDEADLAFLRQLEEFHFVGIPFYSMASACKLYLRGPLFAEPKELVRAGGDDKDDKDDDKDEEDEDEEGSNSNDNKESANSGCKIAESSSKKPARRRTILQLVQTTRRISFHLNHYQTRPYCEQSRYRFGDLYIAQQHQLSNCYLLFENVPEGQANQFQFHLGCSSKSNQQDSGVPGDLLTRAHLGSNLTHRACFDSRHGYNGDTPEEVAATFGAFFAKQPNLEFLDLYYIPRLPSFGLLTRLIKKGAPSLRFIDGLVVMGEEWPELSPSTACILPKEGLKGLRVFLKRTFTHQHLVKVFTELSVAFPRLNCLRIVDLRTVNSGLCIKCPSKGGKGRKKPMSRFDEAGYQRFVEQFALEHASQVVIESEYDFYGKSPTRVECFVSLVAELKALFPTTIVIYE